MGLALTIPCLKAGAQTYSTLTEDKVNRGSVLSTELTIATRELSLLADDEFHCP